MRALNRYLDQKVSDLNATSAKATNYANAHVNDKQAQQVANLCSAAALAGRKLADHARYNRALY
jgi:hypothetical protein